MKKSTHSGTCQVCGRRHTLPGGRMAKHGYQVKNRGMGGYFVGTCRGSDCLPYEQGHDALDHDIAEAQIYRDGIQPRIDELLASESLTITLVMPKRDVWSENRIVTGEVVLTGNEFFQDRFGLKDSDGKVWKIRNNSYEPKTPLDFCKEHRLSLVRGLERERSGLEMHIEAQKKRRADWKPDQPLKPHRRVAVA